MICLWYSGAVDCLLFLCLTDIFLLAMRVSTGEKMRGGGKDRERGENYVKERGM